MFLEAIGIVSLVLLVCTLAICTQEDSKTEDKRIDQLIDDCKKISVQLSEMKVAQRQSSEYTQQVFFWVGDIREKIITKDAKKAKPTKPKRKYIKRKLTKDW